MGALAEQAWRNAALVLVLAVAVCGCAPDTASEYIARAQQSLANNKPAAAAIELKNALRIDPDNVDARIALGKLSLELGDLPAAAHELRQARRLGATDEATAVLLGNALLGLGEFEPLLKELAPDNLPVPELRSELLVLRGEALLALNRPTEAEREFRAAKGADADSVGARIGLSQVLVMSQQVDAAKQQLEEAKALQPRNPAIANAFGRLHAADRRYLEARESFSEAMTLAEGEGFEHELLFALAGLADVQLSLNDVKAARESIARLAELSPEGSTTRYLQARAAFLSGEYDTARNELEHILARDPGNAPAQLLLGAVSYAQGNLGQADMYLSGVLVAEPGNSFARQLLANTRMRQQKPQEALAALEPALQGGDKNMLALAGWAALQSGDVQGGLTYLERDAAARPGDVRAQLQLAAGHIATGQPEQAAAILERIPTEQGSEYLRDLMLITARTRSGDAAGALQVAKRLNKEHPDDSTMLVVLANLQASNGNVAEARNQLARAIELAPRNPLPVFTLGRLEYQQKNFSAAEQRFRQALALQPGNPIILVAVAQVELVKGDSAAAVRTLEAAYRAEPPAVEPRVMLGLHYLAQGELDRAEPLAQEAVKLAPSNAAALNLLGQVFGAGGRASESLSSIEAAVKRQPNSATYRFNLSRAYLGVGRVEEALAAARECLRIDPTYVPALALTGSLLVSSDPKAADELVKRIRQVSPNHPAAIILEGDLQFAKGQYAQAVQSYQKAFESMPTQTLALREYSARRRGQLRDQTAPLTEWIERNPQDEHVRLVFAQAEESAGHTDVAIREYEAVIRIDPQNAVALNNLAWLYHRRSDARALQIARQAYEAQPETGEIVDTYGWLLVEKGELKNGIELLRKAIRLAPNQQEIRYHLAVGLARAGQGPEARRHLQELLDSPGGFSERDAAARLLRELGSGS